MGKLKINWTETEKTVLWCGMVLSVAFVRRGIKAKEEKSDEKVRLSLHATKRQDVPRKQHFSIHCNSNRAPVLRQDQ